MGRIMTPEIIGATFEVIFIDPRFADSEFMANEENHKLLENDVFFPVDIKDLEFVEDGGADDEFILENLSGNDPRWWCKVEDGYILNLLGERKNKIPYDYNS